MANYLKSKCPKCEIKGITTLATSRYGSDVIPSEEKISKVLTKAGLSSEKEFSDLTGEDIRSKTGTELQMYIISGKKGRDGLTERFGKK